MYDQGVLTTGYKSEKVIKIFLSGNLYLYIDLILFNIKIAFIIKDQFLSYIKT